MSLADDPRRFRLGDEKEAAGGAVAVIEAGIMDIECDCLNAEMPFGVRWWARERENGAGFGAACAIEPIGGGAERGFGAIVGTGHTLQPRRAWNKPAERIGRGDHEESSLAR